LEEVGKIGPWLFCIDGKNIEWLPQANVEVSDDVLGIVSQAVCPRKRDTLNKNYF
jgi:hypothetical protein